MTSLTQTPVLDIRQLSLEFPSPLGPAQVLDGLSLNIAPGEIVGLVGESGSGKSVTGMASMRLLDPRRYRVTAGSISLLGRDVMALPEFELASMRGRDVAMVFQEPMNALNPSIRVGRQIADVVRQHQGLERSAARSLALATLERMQIEDAARVMECYPHMISGGMRQRVLLAMAFSCHPRLLIADEPTTALDVLVQAEILRLLWHRARDLGTAVLFISHDMATVKQLCDRVYVLYAGQIVESGEVGRVLAQPAHPYTRALLQAMPATHGPGQRLLAIDGVVPSLIDPPTGCRFRSRCSRAEPACLVRPPMTSLEEGSRHGVACWHHHGYEGESR